MVRHLVWDDRYSVGVAGLDDDHKQMFRAVNALCDEIMKGNRGGSVHELLDDLLESAIGHFEREEQALERIGFPDLQAHREDHYLLLRNVLKFSFELKYHRLDSKNVVDFLTQWVVTHIVEHDAKFRPYFEREVKG